MSLRSANIVQLARFPSCITASIPIGQKLACVSSVQIYSMESRLYPTPCNPIFNQVERSPKRDPSTKIFSLLLPECLATVNQGLSYGSTLNTFQGSTRINKTVQQKLYECVFNGHNQVYDTCKTIPNP